MKHKDLSGEHITINSTVSHLKTVRPTQWFKNVWVYETEGQRYNPLLYVKVNGNWGILTGMTRNNGRSLGQFPQAQGEFWRVEGSSKQRSAIVVFSKEEPELIVGEFLNPLAWIEGCEDCTIDVRGSHAGQGVVIKDSKNCRVRLRGHDFGEGVCVSGGSQGIIVENSEINTVCKVPIRFTRSTNNCVAEYNTCKESGLVESVAGIYLTGKNGVARNNFIKGVRFGNFWEHDGAGIFTDNYAENNLVINNLVTDCHIAYKDNSGSPGNRFYGNGHGNCDHEFKQSDSERIGMADTIIQFGHVPMLNANARP